MGALLALLGDHTVRTVLAGWSIIGFGAAHALDAATSGMMALSLGVIFVLVFAVERAWAALRPRRAPGVG